MTGTESSDGTVMESGNGCLVKESEMSQPVQLIFLNCCYENNSHVKFICKYEDVSVSYTDNQFRNEWLINNMGRIDMEI